ncbi:MAG: phosphatidate cytidylyltransferase [Xanthomonadales bacterium]|nr:phosphatidate cytidylyltransferase [Xanthomonadales bacterium]
MLRTRVLTAMVLAPLAFLLVFQARPGQFGAIMALLLMVGAWEFRKLGGMQKGVAGWLLLAAQGGLLLAVYQVRDALAAHALALLTAACLLWLLMLLRLVVYRAGAVADFQFRIVSFACALTSLTFAWIALYWLHSGPQGSWWILLLLLIIWSADIGAYFTGRAWGRRKLAPTISPGKTVAGLAGGVVAAIAVSVAAAQFIPHIEAGLFAMTAIALITALVSVGGDLFISLHKRVTGFKDSGALFPGHGGVLDRFDSLLAGAPFFALCKLALGL